MKRHITLTVLVSLYKLIELDIVSRHDGVALVTHLQIGIARKLETEVGIVRALVGGDINHRLVILQLHLRHVEGEIKESVAVAGSILSSGLFPHDLLSLPRQSDECEQCGNDDFLHCFQLFVCKDSTFFSKQ